MLYLPLMNDLRFWQNDVVFIDEAQDTNNVQLHLLRRMVKPMGRIVAVGDPSQAIYGFRGADSDAMDNLKSQFDMVELPLTVSYRCSREVVREAQRIVQHIQASDEAEEGSVSHWDPEEEGEIPEFDPEDAVLCRTTAPLFELAYKIIASGKGCKILGRDLGEGLISLVDKMNAEGMDQLEERLQAFCDRETEKFMRDGNWAAVEAVSDRIKCIQVVINSLLEDERTIPRLHASIRNLFNTQDGIVTLSTIHRVKGMEWNRVWILRPDLLPHPLAQKTWEKIQERNLKYVAITRAKRDLVWLSLE